LGIEGVGEGQGGRIALYQGSLTCRGARFPGRAAAFVVGASARLDPPRLAAFEGVPFEFARPPAIALNAPNRECGSGVARQDAGRLRRGGHRFERAREELRGRAWRASGRFWRRARRSGVGAPDRRVWAAAQKGVFT
jgi:hypothetical protein